MAGELQQPLHEAGLTICVPPNVRSLFTTASPLKSQPVFLIDSLFNELGKPVNLNPDTSTSLPS